MFKYSTLIENVYIKINVWFNMSVRERERELIDLNDLIRLKTL